MRTAFIETLCELAERDERIWLLTGDLGYSVLECFSTRFPHRFVNVGVAEQNMTGVAAGLALCGKVVFTYSIANFPIMRCLEQIRNDVCYHNLNVKIVAVGDGLSYGSAGYTHHAIEDIAVMRAMPNMIVIAPSDPVEARLATQAIVEEPGPCYLRLGKSGAQVEGSRPPRFHIGKAIRLRDGQDATFIAAGTILGEVIKAAEMLAEHGILAGVISMPTIKPLDIEAVLEAAERTRWIFTVEEHSLVGGLGSAVAEVLARTELHDVAFCPLGIPDTASLAVGGQEYLKVACGLSASAIVDTVVGLLQGGELHHA